MSTRFLRPLDALLAAHPTAQRLVVGAADPQAAVVLGRAPALAQPVRQPDVVGMHVGDQHAQHRQALQLLLEHLLPQRARFGPVDAAVHHGPAFAALKAVAQQPKVDVVERERQAHAQPFDARPQFDGAPRRGQLVTQRVVQGTFEFGGK